MSMQDAHYLNDIRKHLDTISYGTGEIFFRIVKHKVVEVSIPTLETSKRDTPDEYLKDIILFVRALQKNSHTGRVKLELDWKNGSINTLGYYTEIKKEYRK